MPKPKKAPAKGLFREMLIKTIPLEIHSSFKAYCALRNITMSSKIVSLIRECLKDATLTPTRKKDNNESPGVTG